MISSELLLVLPNGHLLRVRFALGRLPGPPRATPLRASGGALARLSRTTLRASLVSPRARRRAADSHTGASSKGRRRLFVSSGGARPRRRVAPRRSLAPPDAARVDARFGRLLPALHAQGRGRRRGGRGHAREPELPERPPRGDAAPSPVRVDETHARRDPRRGHHAHGGGSGRPPLPARARLPRPPPRRGPRDADPAEARVGGPQARDRGGGRARRRVAPRRRHAAIPRPQPRRRVRARRHRRRADANRRRARGAPRPSVRHADALIRIHGGQRRGVVRRRVPAHPGDDARRWRPRATRLRTSRRRRVPRENSGRRSNAASPRGGRRRRCNEQLAPSGVRAAVPRGSRGAGAEARGDAEGAPSRGVGVDAGGGATRAEGARGAPPRDRRAQGGARGRGGGGGAR